MTFKRYSDPPIRLTDHPSFEPIKRIEACLDYDIFSLPESNEEEKSRILKLTPDYKYAKYMATQGKASDARKNYWRETFVFDVMEEIFR